MADPQTDKPKTTPNPQSQADPAALEAVRGGDTAEEAMVAAELDDDGDPSRSTGAAVVATAASVSESPAEDALIVPSEDELDAPEDLARLAEVTGSQSLDAAALAQQSIGNGGAGATAYRRPLPKKKTNESLKKTAIFPLITLGLILLGFALYGLLIEVGHVEVSDHQGRVMPKVMIFIGGPIGLALAGTGGFLLWTVLQEREALAAKPPANGKSTGGRAKA